MVTKKRIINITISFLASMLSLYMLIKINYKLSFISTFVYYDVFYILEKQYKTKLNLFLLSIFNLIALVFIFIVLKY